MFLILGLIVQNCIIIYYINIKFFIILTSALFCLKRKVGFLGLGIGLGLWMSISRVIWLKSKRYNIIYQVQ